MRSVKVRIIDEAAAERMRISPPLKPPERCAGVKHDADKARWDLLPWEEIGQIVEVLTHGALKYAPENWKHVPDPGNRYFAAAMRHLHAHRLGDALDDDSGLPHLAHAACCILFLMHFENESACTPST